MELRGRQKATEIIRQSGEGTAEAKADVERSAVVAGRAEKKAEAANHVFSSNIIDCYSFYYYEDKVIDPIALY